MAGRGQNVNPELRRYDDAPECSAIYLMAVDTETPAQAMVKVGRSRVPKCRLRELHSALVRCGYTPGRFLVFPTCGRDIYRAELACIHALQKVACTIGATREYFSGIALDDAAVLVASTLQAVPT